VATERTVLDLSREGLWTDPRFRKMVVAAVVRDGAPPDVAEMIAAWIDHDRPASYSEFHAMARRRCSSLEGEEGKGCATALSVLAEHVEFNRSCFLRDSPEKTRVIQWPNNPATREKQPDHYFDLHEDFCFRTPHRFITRETPIGSAGSCFALRIAHQLQLWGYNYVLEEDDLPPGTPLAALTSTSYRMSSARCGTLFNVPSMRQMVERAFGDWMPERLIVRDGARIIDPFRSTKAAYSDDDGYHRDYEAHTSALRRALLRCDVFVLTLGLTEAWQFADSGAYTSISPWKIDPAVLRHKTLTVADNVEELERLLAAYRRRRPEIRLIVSVSPVPLNKTFSPDKHVVEANTLSKAVLRIAADEFCARHPDSVFYLPAYEIVMSGTRNPWEADMRHVSPEAVGRVMGLFQRMFLVDQDPLPGAALPPPPAASSSRRREPRRILRNLAKRILGR
jgi:GSCFA family